MGSRRFGHGVLALAIGLVWSVAHGQTQAEAVAPLHSDVTLLADKLTRPTNALTWVFTGDSITHGAKWLGRERSYSEIFQERLRWEMRRGRDLVINSGLSGERTAGLLADFDWRVLRFKPDVVSVMIGMNDAVAGPAGRAAFEANLREIIVRIRAARAIPILNRTNPIDAEDKGSSSRADLPAYNEIIARVAKSENVILADHWEHWTMSRPDAASLRAWLADPIHPNAAGHRQFAICLFKALGIFVPAAASCQP